jgi:hypothetical protein
MTHNPYFRFHQTAAQLRRVAARGGRASARNRRARLRAAAPPPPPAVPPPEPQAETTAAAIAALEAQFPWLRGADQRLQPSYGPGLRRGGPISSAPQFPVVDSAR